MSTNEPRAQAASIALETYRGEGQQTTQEAMTDLLTDFMHLCRLKKIDFLEVLNMARTHYNFETGKSETKREI